MQKRLSSIQLLLLLLPATKSLKANPLRRQISFTPLSLLYNSGVSETSLKSTIVPSVSKTELKMAHMDSPSAQRNKTPIWSILKELVPKLTLSASSTTSDNTLQVLEIAAGVGVHTLHFTTQMVEELNLKVKWFASDPDETSLEGLHARIQSCENPSVLESLYSPPLSIALCEDGFLKDKKEDFDSVIVDGQINLMICINMIHISPWDATIGLFKVASTKLKKDGLLYCYGPYKENGTAVESNL